MSNACTPCLPSCYKRPWTQPTTVSVSSMDAVLKRYYTDDKINDQTFASNPLFALIKKG